MSKCPERFYQSLSSLFIGISIKGFNNCLQFRAVSTSLTSSSLLAPSPLTQPDTSTNPGKKVQVFIAAGKVGRTLMSCDDGLTWIHDRSDNDSTRCWTEGPNNLECDHATSSFTGMDVSDDGFFYNQYGWCGNGTIRRSRDYSTWEVIKSDEWRLTRTGVAGNDCPIRYAQFGWRSLDKVRRRSF